MRAWTGVNLIKPQTLVKEGAKWWPPPPTCCCLHWISGLSPLRRQQDTHMHTAGGEGGGCRLWNWSRCWPDIIYRWTHAQTLLLRTLGPRPQRAVGLRLITIKMEASSFRKAVKSHLLFWRSWMRVPSSSQLIDRPQPGRTTSPQQPLKRWFSPLGVMSKHGTFKRWVRPLFVVRPLIIYCKHSQSCMFLLRRANFSLVFTLRW